MPGYQNIIHQLLVKKKKIILSPLHIKLCLMKQLNKALQQTKPCFQYLKVIFPKISGAILKRAYLQFLIYVSFLNNEVFKVTMNLSLQPECIQKCMQRILGKHQEGQRECIVENLSKCYQNLGYNKSLKVHFLHSQLFF